jgi:hypothetical protein
MAFSIPLLCGIIIQINIYDKQGKHLFLLDKRNPMTYTYQPSSPHLLIPLSGILLFLYYLSFKNATFYLYPMPWVRIDTRRYMITPRMAVAPKAIVKITRNSFVVALTGGTLDSMTLNLTMGASFQSLVLTVVLKKSRHGILL